ncbi:MAG: tripartite tricarboxylate transporter TctB family protein [Clostridia bacterium]|nr:tripartite tricarboxylate transporter TctB family protein [Clostridia bacterium]
MKIKIPTNLIGGILIMLLSFIVWMLIPNQINIGEAAMQKAQSNSRLIPDMLAIGIGISGALLVFQSLVFKKEVYKEYNLGLEAKGAIYLVILIVYIVLVEYVGMLVACLLMGIGSLVYFRTKKIRRYIIVFAFFIVIYLVFSLVLKVKFPTLGGLK